MKSKKSKPELNIDFIESRPLTDEEAKELSNYISKVKESMVKKKKKVA